MRDLAGAILHLTWHPNKEPILAFQLHWKGDDPKTLDFAEGDLRGRLNTLVEETLSRSMSSSLPSSSHMRRRRKAEYPS